MRTGESRSVAVPLRCLTVAALSAQPSAQTFAPPVTTFYSSASLRTQVLTDLDEDGHLDWVFGDNGAPATLYLQYGDGSGSFGGRVTTTSALLLNQMTATDWNRDGHADLVVTNAPGTTYVHLGAGDGTVGPLQFLASMQSTLVFDADLDGDPDLLGLANGEVQILRQTLAGSLQLLASYPPLSIPRWVVADADGDGDQDVVILARTGSPSLMTVLRANGGPPVLESLEEVHPSPLSGPVLGDLDEDGDLDAVLVDSQRLLTSRYHAGRFEAAQLLYVGSPAVQALAVTDVDTDGHLDVVVSDVSANLRILRGRGDGTFEPPVLQSVQATRIQVVDLDQDGAADLFVGHASQSMFYANLTAAHPGVSVYATGTPDCRGYVTIGVNEPVTLGSTTLRLRFANAPQFAMGVGVIGGPPDPGGYQTGLGVLLHTGAGIQSSLGLFAVDSVGSGSVSLPVPANPAIRGLDAYAQGFFLTSSAPERGCTTSPFQLVSSRGLAVVVQ